MIIKCVDTKKVHIHFGGCGGSYSYLLGVGSYLQQNYDLSNVVFSGISGGNIIALLLILEMDIDDAFRHINIPFLLRLQSYKMKSFYNFIPEFKKELLNIINVDKNNYLKACGRLYVNITRVFPFKNEIISNFTSNEDLIDCILASSHIPVYSNTLFYTFRNSYYLDGYLSAYDNFDNHDYFGQNFITLKFNIGTFRVLENHFLFLSTCDKLARQLYKYGSHDIKSNILVYHPYLHSKSN